MDFKGFMFQLNLVASGYSFGINHTMLWEFEYTANLLGPITFSVIQFLFTKNKHVIIAFLIRL